MSDAVALVRKHGNLQAALKAQPSAEGARAVGFFMKMRPEEGASEALRTFQDAVRAYQHDSRTLEPLLARYGNRALRSFGLLSDDDQALDRDLGTFVQRIREARSASRKLPVNLEKLRSLVPASVSRRVEAAPVESLVAVLPGGKTGDAREKAAKAVNQLRILFTQTGFGDPLTVPADFESRVEIALSTSTAAPKMAVTATSYQPSVLDLLLGLSTFSTNEGPDVWPPSVVRARTVDEIVSMAATGRHFDTIVIDDADDYGPNADVVSLSSRLVHRLGRADHEHAILLGRPHFHQDAELAEAVIGRSSRWLGCPDGIGIMVRTAPGCSLDQLAGLAERLAAALRAAGFNAATSLHPANADFIVATAEQFRDADVPSLARLARKGLIVLCRLDLRSGHGDKQPIAATEGIALAESFGWRVARSAIEGTIVEKDGRRAVVLEEPLMMDERDGTVADTVNRLAEMGWRPIVVWHGQDRERDEYVKLLDENAIRTNVQVRSLVESFDLSAPPPTSGDRISMTSGDRIRILKIGIAQATSVPATPVEERRISGSS